MTERFLPMQRWLPVALSFLTVALLLLGIVRTYSPVPFWDSWDGYVSFYERVRGGQPWAWLEFHAEHRLVVTRLFFYADLAWFGGMGVVPLTANVLLAGATAAILCRALSDLHPDTTAKDLFPWWAVLVALEASWLQEQNFTWSFQPQFFLATGMPLATLYVATRAAAVPRSRGMFALACALGVLSAGTMANGVLALPLLAVFAVMTGMQPTRVAVSAVLALAGIATARLGALGGAGGSEYLHVLLTQPLDVLRYALIYLGGPIWTALARSGLSAEAREWAAFCVGAVTASLTIAACVEGIRGRRERPLRLALALFAIYACATAILTAVGRVNLPDGAPYASRYATVSLTAWAALLVVTARPTWMRSRGAGWIPVVATLCLVAVQLPARGDRAYARQAQWLAALALELDVADDEAIRAIYPVPSRIAGTVQQAKALHLSIFGHPPLSGRAEVMGTVINPARCVPVQGTSTPTQDTRFSRFSVAMAPDSRMGGDGALLITRRGTVVGAVVAGLRHGSRRLPAEGYILSTAVERPLLACPDATTHST